MSFKETIIGDLDKVFFSTDEFAEECSWNKSMIKAIIDDDNLIHKYSAEFSILPQGSHLIFVALNQFSKQPNINDVVAFNNNLYTINEIKNEYGMLAIFLSNGRG